MGSRSFRLTVALVATLALAAGLTVVTTSRSGVSRQPGPTPITHVVILFQENHSFDEVLGGLCVREVRCDGATSGRISNGNVIPLQPAPDIVPDVTHNVASQTKAIDGSKMDGFDLIKGCDASTGYACYQQYAESQIPNLTALARAFAISDRTFELGPVPSWGGHLHLVAGQSAGFTGDNPHAKTTSPVNSGWGCDSLKDAAWKATPSTTPVLIPACIPKVDGSGPYRASPARWIPTLMDRLEAAHLSWQIDAPGYGQNGYVWSICPSFADCLYSPQASHMRASAQVLTDAQQGNLPAVSIVIPCCRNSQHNLESMRQGDNWIGSVVSAIMNGPDWSSTAILITYDDCGCFYDHVAPPPGLGIRVPMVIVSPYARARSTDSNTASFASILAFIEHTFDLPPLTSADANAYDYADSFNYRQTPQGPIALEQHPLSPSVQAWLRAHPPDSDDPT
jgi:phospholipase C